MGLCDDRSEQKPKHKGFTKLSRYWATLTFG